MNQAEEIGVGEEKAAVIAAIPESAAPESGRMLVMVEKAEDAPPFPTPIMLEPEDCDAAAARGSGAIVTVYDAWL